ncbi:carbonic anhydrase [Pinirhizobacter sp.]|jgi:carbonic anhydrase|uniref:carbonic anhydrase n=1 Tax=Pinirhizobacter sp. TaxID=2950432 RepID=UPI002F42C560
MQKLFDGYARFRSTQWPERRKTFEGLADEGQNPQTMVIACSDSRVDPTMIFDAEPGELFILRNVANLVPPYEPDTAFHATSAALEYAVRVLEVKDLIVMGHAMCGGIRVLLDGPPAQGGDFLVPWMRIAESAKFRVLARAPEDVHTECEYETVKLSLGNLMTFPWLAERVESGALKLTGMSFDIRSGQLLMLQGDGTFAPVQTP